MIEPADDPKLPQMGQLWGMLIRQRWIILAMVACTIAATAFFSYWQTPVYQASVALRIQDKQPNLPEVFRDLTRGSDIATEMEVLNSRAVIEDAAQRLGLRFQLTSPRRVRQGELVTQVEVSDSASPGTYRFLRLADGRFAVTDDSSGARLTVLKPGQVGEFAGVRLILTPEAAKEREIVAEVQDAATMSASVRAALSVSQPSRDANIVQVQYEGTDPEIVRRLVNVMANRYIARRQDAFKAEARSSATFLREQVDRVGQQLAAVEDSFRSFRERAQVIDPAVEASSEVSRLIAKEAERSSLESERQALAQSLEQLNHEAAEQKPGSPSPYRQLLAFPTLLRSQTVSELLTTLTTVENERTTLLTRRTEQDPDVRVLSDRIRELEGQLRGLAVTYLSGLTNQVSSLDTALGAFNRELDAIPRKQVQYARLQRKSKGLEDAYNMLQTRLKEAEIAQAIDDPSVQVVDTALTPDEPSRPNPELNMIGGLCVGLLLGVAGGLLREHLDRSVHTRRDVMSATGLPVMGLIPRLSRESGERLALITEKHSALPRRSVASPAAEGRRRSFTFLQVGPTTAGPAQSGASTGGPLVSSRKVRFTLSGSGTPASEAYGILQTNIAFARSNVEVKTLVLTSPLSGDGKSTCAVNLALTLAHRGLKTLIIDGDLRRGVVHTAFNAPKQPGLTDVLHGTVELSAAIRQVEVGDHGAVLDYLTAGTPPPNPSGVVESAPMRALLEQVACQYDRILIDSPPVNIVTDAALLGASVDGVLLVARAGVTDSAALAYAMEQLRHVGAPVLGVVLNDIDFRRDAAYDGAYRYYNHNEYVSPTAPT
ncbi:MAG TPA: polysaccharide biosynthesis tyrosine autokinase [Gemmatimonadales bacterium]|jgi:capsular exopolysaccharide synthesis family protein|nr:polysaccharide biosynthesis tyrosine autokinase [Gemmatimonadales bacterium]